MTLKTKAMKLAITILSIAAILASCGTTREVQMQRGTYEVINGHINFKPVDTWQKFDVNSAPDTIFRLRNTAVRKNKIPLTY